jgi:glutaredoxin
MRFAVKLIAIVVIAILLLSSVYVFWLQEEDSSDNDDSQNNNNKNNNDADDTENDEEDNNTNEDNDEDDNGDDENDEGDDEGDDGDDNEENGGEEVMHTVFIEEGTGTTCQYCPDVADILNDLYLSGEYRFYYISLVEDKNSKASERLNTEYNRYGLPTVFIDGGYRVLLGGTHETSEFAQAIRDAESRQTATIKVSVHAEYETNSSNFNTQVFVENQENQTYTGNLRVFLTEVISRWNGIDGKPIRYAFLDYLINKDISIETQENISFSQVWNVSGLDPENLMIFAVVFNSESHQGYAYPPEDYPFDAHYADACNATELVEGGNLPPEVGITFPEQGRQYLRGHPIFKSSYEKTRLLGKATIVAYANDDSAIDSVEIAIFKGERMVLNATFTDTPYELEWKKLALGKYTISVTAYDDEGKTASASIDVWAFIRPFLFKG